MVFPDGDVRVVRFMYLRVSQGSERDFVNEQERHCTVLCDLDMEVI